MSRNSSALIWEYFKRNTNDKIAECNICKKSISYKTTITNLKQHLQIKHISVCNHFLSRSLSRCHNRVELVATSSGAPSTLRPNENSDAGTSGECSDNLDVSNNLNLINTVPVSSHRQKTIVSYLPRQLGQEEKKRIDKALLRLMTVDFQPFSIVEDKGFKEFVSLLNPNYDLPSRKTLSNLLLSTEYSERFAEMQNLVQQRCLSVCVTMDCWTSRNMESYMAMTGHFIDQETLEFRSILINCAALEGHHTGERLAVEMREIFNTWHIFEKINLIVTDNAANMVAAARILQKKHYGCFAHKLNLIVQTALSDRLISQTIKKVQQTVSHFKRSAIAKERLLRYQATAQNISVPKSLLLAIPTRWSSTYLMFARYSSLQEALRATIPNLNTELPIISIEEWACINQICEVLKPFKEVTTLMSNENYLVASKAVVLVAGLNSVCNELLQQNFHNPVKNLLLNLKNGIFTRLGDIEEQKPIALCTMLDPRFKHYAFENEVAMMSAKFYLEDKITTLYAQDVAEEVVIPNSPESYSTMTSLWGNFDKKITSARQPKTAEEKARDELSLYWRENVIPRSECPIKWWKEHKFIYPKLFEIFLCNSNIIITSVPCERIFSKTLYIISDRRTRLTTSKIKKVMFLNSLKSKNKI